jgi:two-component system cell cycle response regulator
MTARVLVVDDNPANRKLLEVRLNTEYFEVLTAANGADALTICEKGMCDIVLLDVMMPDMDGFEVCRRLKGHIATAHMPILMVTALDQPADRVKGLEAGADDFLTKPIDEVQLIARVRALARLKTAIDELRNRANTTVSLGMIAPFAVPSPEDGKRGRLLIVDDRKNSAERLSHALSAQHAVVVEPNAQEAMFKAAEDHVDVMIISLGLANYDALRLCSQIRALERTRHLPILLIADVEDRQRVLRGLELGINDWLSRPVDRNELLARVRTQLRQKRYTDSLREKVQQSIELALLEQSPLPGKPSDDDAGERAHPPRAADADDPRHRLLQEGQRQLRPRLRRRGPEGFRRPPARHRAHRRPPVPSRRRGIRAGHAQRRRDRGRPHRRARPRRHRGRAVRDGGDRTVDPGDGLYRLG